MSNLSALCKICIYYKTREKTCSLSVVATDKGKVNYEHAKSVRLDKTKCGPQGKWFNVTMGPDGLSKKTPVEELYDSFDI